MLARLALLAYLVATLLPSLVTAPAVASSPQSFTSTHGAGVGDSNCVDCDADDDDDSLADEDANADEECLPPARVAAHTVDPSAPLYLANPALPESTPPASLFRPPRHVSV